MFWLVLSLIPVAFVIASISTAVVLRVSHRVGALDTGPRAGQVKAAARAVPNTGGVGIFLGFALPALAVQIALSLHAGGAIDLAAWLPAGARVHLAGMLERLGMGWVLLGTTAALHVLGLVDDRRPLGPAVKSIIMAAAAAVVTIFTDTRLLEAVDGPVGGPWLSIAITIVWFLVVTNAFNFIDNMDGLSAGVAVIAGGCLLATSLIAGQYFVPSLLALVIGASLGFLVFNFPPARIFMGDGGSLVLGFLLAFATVRATYLPEHAEAFQPHAVFTPIIILAIPLYDLVSVVAIRLGQGRSPFVGDLQHFSHRLVQRGLSRRDAVLVIYGCTLVTALGGVAMPALRPWQALLVVAQTMLVLFVVAIFERASAPREPTP